MNASLNKITQHEANKHLMRWFFGRALCVLSAFLLCQMNKKKKNAELQKNETSRLLIVQL